MQETTIVSCIFFMEQKLLSLLINRTFYDTETSMLLDYRLVTPKKILDVP